MSGTDVGFPLSRRQVVARLGLFPVAVAMIGSGSSVLAQTGEPTAAEPTTCPNPDLQGGDIVFRESLEYVDVSPFGREKDCEKCESWIAAQAGPCGGCTIMRGAVHARGYCTSWVKV